MRNVDGGDAQFLLYGANIVAQLYTDLGIEGRKWLVQQKRLGVHGKRAGKGHTLLLPARKLVGVALGKVLHVNELEHFIHAFLGVGFGKVRHFQAKSDVFPHGHVGEECIILKDHAKVAACRRHVGDILAIYQNGSLRWNFETGNHA